MGNREDLLDGARRCLFDKGYARTTVRDIATASGVSMAAIGYHFGSKEALFATALAEATREWGDELARTLTDSPASDDDPMRRFENRWAAALEAVAANRGLWTATFGVLADPAAREQLTATQSESQAGLAELFSGAIEDGESRRVLGPFYQALLIGLAAQQLIDPATAPSAHDLAAALRRLTSA